MDISDINGRIRDLVAQGKAASAYDIIHGELVQYYSEDEGKEELRNSPHRGLKTAEAVALLMQGVPKRIEREVKALHG